MFDPPIEIIGKVTACVDGRVLTDFGHVYAFDAEFPFHGSPSGNDYWLPGMVAVRIVDSSPGGYTILNQQGQSYRYGAPA